jgi:hypothetical protein
VSESQHNQGPRNGVLTFFVYLICGALLVGLIVLSSQTRSAKTAALMPKRDALPLAVGPKSVPQIPTGNVQARVKVLVASREFTHTIRNRDDLDQLVQAIQQMVESEISQASGRVGASAAAKDSEKLRKAKEGLFDFSEANSLKVEVQYLGNLMRTTHRVTLPTYRGQNRELARLTAAKRLSQIHTLRDQMEHAVFRKP